MFTFLGHSHHPKALWQLVQRLTVQGRLSLEGDKELAENKTNCENCKPNNSTKQSLIKMIEISAYSLLTGS